MNRKEKYPQIVAISNVDGTLYFKGYNSPGTFMLKKGSESLCVIQEMNKPYIWHQYMYSDCARYKNMLVFVPYVDAEFITILDTQSFKFSYVKNTGGYRYKKAIAYNDQIYMFGEHLDGGRRMLLDMESMNVTSITWKGKKVEPAITFDNGRKINHKVYWPNFGNGTICVFDFENRTTDKIKIKNTDVPILTVTFDGEYFWLSGIGDEVLIWDEMENKIIDVIQLKKIDRECPWDMRFSASRIMGEYVYFSPVYYNNIIRINRKSKKPEYLFEVGDDEVCWNMCEIEKDRIYIDITNYKKDNSRNCIISADGTIREKCTEFSIQNCYFQENLFENLDNNIEVLINYLASDHDQTI